MINYQRVKGIRYNIVDDLTCIRHRYLAQSVIDMRTAENLVSDRDTQWCRDSQDNGLPYVYSKEADNRMTQHTVEVAVTD